MECFPKCCRCTNLVCIQVKSCACRVNACCCAVPAHAKSMSRRTVSPPSACQHSPRKPKAEALGHCLILPAATKADLRLLSLQQRGFVHTLRVQLSAFASISHHQQLTAGPKNSTAATLAHGLSKLKSKQCCRISCSKVETLTAQASNIQHLLTHSLWKTSPVFCICTAAIGQQVLLCSPFSLHLHLSMSRYAVPEF